MGGRGDAAAVAAAQIASGLGARAVAYAENALEGLDLVSMSDAVCSDPRTMSEIVTADMELVTHALARAYVMGYAAALDDESRPAKSAEGHAARVVRRRARGRNGGGARG